MISWEEQLNPWERGRPARHEREARKRNRAEAQAWMEAKPLKRALARFGGRDARAPGRELARILLTLLVIAIGSLAARAQSPTAMLGGTVMDEAGAVVPGVEITVLNLSTALQRHAATDGEGRYTIPLLPPGRYNLTAERDGFTTVEVRGVVLNVNDQLALRIKLKVGEIGETVTVVDYLAGIGSVREGAAVSTVINRRFVENLPLSGRSFQTLFELAPGTILTRTSFSEQGQFSAAGQRPNANYFMVDGVSANVGVSAGAAPGQSAAGSLPALTALGGTNNLVSVDALEEFRVQTSSYAPEFGRTPGAQISMVTRAGTNELHGSVFNYFRHDALDANDWFVNSRALPPPALRQNAFGGVLGGPLVRDRAFFFASYEGLRLSQPQVSVTEVPSLAARAESHASLRPFLEAYPVPTGRETRSGFAEFAASYSDPSRVDAAAVRFDVIHGERLTVFGRYNHAPSSTSQRGSSVRPGFTPRPLVNPTVAHSLNTITRADLLTETLTVGATFAATPRVLNELRANWSRARARTSFTLDDFGGARPLADALLFPTGVASGEAAFQFVLAQGANAALGAGKNVANEQRQLNLVNHLSASRGAHQLKLGVDYRRVAPVYDPARYSLAVLFGEFFTPVVGGTTQVAPSPLSVSVFAGAEPRHPVFTNFSAYAQDAWRVSNRLSLTYGVRWELNPPPHEADGVNPLVVAVNLDRPDLTRLAPQGTPLWRTTYTNFAPRLGLAYQLSDEPGRELVVRAGGGIFYDLGTGQAAQVFGSVSPFVAVRRLLNTPFPLAPEQATPPPLNLSPPFATVVAFDPQLKLPRTYQWNLTLEKSLGQGQTVSAAYVGALGRRLLTESALLGPNGDFDVVLFTSNSARSSYHALQVQTVGRLSRHLQALASYTWSHSIDNASSDALSRVRGAGGTARISFAGVDRGPSDFDVRHSLTAAATYSPPAPRDERGALSALARDWSLDAVFRARTATPVNVVTRTEVIGSGLVVELQRPDLIPGVPIYLEDPSAPGGRRINPAAFRAPVFTVQGTLGYNALRGFGLAQLDLALRREIGLRERARLQLRAEIFNVLNRPSFGNPVGNMSSAEFGRSTQTFARSLGAGGINGGLSPLYQVGGPRSVQLAIKLNF